MAINLSRNTKVYFTTNVGTDGSITDANSGFSNANTFEIQVLDGYSFSQNTETQQITVNEAGNRPVRGSRTFNTALAPVDWNITTYFRPLRSTNVVTAAERVLWNALMGSGALSSTALSVTNITRTTTSSATVTATFGASHGLVAGDTINFNGSTADSTWNQAARVTTSSSATAVVAEMLRAPATAAGTTSGTLSAYTGQWAQSGTQAGTFSYTSTMGSQRNQLQTFGMLFVVDNVVYGVENCALNQASIDFGLDQIAQIAWTGQGTRLKQMATVTGTHLSANSATATTTANYITNKLSTMTLQSKVGGSENTSSVAYTVAITGGNLTINNNITYLTPTNLGVVNQPVTYFTGTRSISGNVTAYLKTGADQGGSATGTGTLLSTLLANANTDTEPKFKSVLHLGGVTGTSGIKVDFEMNGTMLQIPTVEIQDVVSTTINFVAQPYNPEFVAGANDQFDLERSNELMVKYFST